MATKSSPKRFILFGDAGAGKSTFVNFLYNHYHGTTESKKIFCPKPQVKLAIPCANWIGYLDENYKNNSSEYDIHDQTKSQTRDCSTYKIDTENSSLEIIDTPGFNDTNGVNTDEQNLKMIEEKLKEVPHLNGIIVIVNGSVPRIGVSFKNFLHMLYQVWPNDLLNNSIAILTNCDELSVNLNSTPLKQYLCIDESKVYCLQNSLFRWDPTNQSKKTMNCFRQTFEQNLEIIPSLMKKLSEFNPVSTRSFEVGAIKVLLISDNICKSIQKLLDLLEKYREQKIAFEGLTSAQNTMKRNQDWQKYREINAIKWVEVPSRHQSPQIQDHRRYSQQFSLRDQQTSAQNPELNQSMVRDDTSIRFHPKDCLNYDPPHCNSVRKHSIQLSDQTNPNCNDVKMSKNICVVRANNQSTTSLRPDCPMSQAQGPHQYYQSTRGEYNNRFPQRCLRIITGRCSGIAKYPSKNSPPSDGPHYRQQQTKLQVTLPDNEAQSYYSYAAQEKLKLKEKLYDLEQEQQELKNLTNQLMDELRKQVAELRSINRKFDILEKNRGLLGKFKDIIARMDGNEEIQKYYEEIVAILSIDQIDEAITSV